MGGLEYGPSKDLVGRDPSRSGEKQRNQVTGVPSFTWFDLDRRNVMQWIIADKERGSYSAIGKPGVWRCACGTGTQTWLNRDLNGR